MIVRLTELAAADLANIADEGNNRWGDKKAAEYQQQLTQAIEFLPLSKTLRPLKSDLGVIYRQNVGRHCILLEKNGDFFDVFMIIDQAADIPSHLDERQRS